MPPIQNDEVAAAPAPLPSKRPLRQRVLAGAIAVVVVLVMVVVVGRDAVMDWRADNPLPAPVNSDGIAEVDGIAISLTTLEPYDFVHREGSQEGQPYEPPEGWTSWFVEFAIHEINPDTEIYSLDLTLIASDGNIYGQSRQLPYSIVPEGLNAPLRDDPGPMFGAFLLPDGVTPVSARVSGGFMVSNIWSFDYKDVG